MRNTLRLIFSEDAMKNHFDCICGNCKNKMRVKLSDEDAEILIYEKSEHRGRRMSVIVPRELGVILCDWINENRTEEHGG